MDSNELRRTKEKLRVLQETPNIKLVIIDLAIMMGKTNPLYWIGELEKEYKHHIEQNVKQGLEQGKIF